MNEMVSKQSVTIAKSRKGIPSYHFRGGLMVIEGEENNLVATGRCRNQRNKWLTVNAAI